MERDYVFYKNRFGITIAANLYTPRGMDRQEKHPAIAIGPPRSGVKRQDSGIYAKRMAQQESKILPRARV